MSEKRQERTVSKLAIQKAHHLKAAWSSFVPFCLKKDQKKNLVSFLVDSIAREHLAFLALTPPEFFTFPGGGSWGVLIRKDVIGNSTNPDPEWKRGRY